MTAAFSGYRYLLILMIGTGILLFGSIGMIKNVSAFTADIFGLNLYTVYFKSDADPQEISTFVTELKNNGEIREVVFVSGQQVQENIVERYPSFAAELNHVETVAFPAYADITFTPVDAKQISRALTAIKENQTVDDVQDYRRLSDELVIFLNSFTYVGYTIRAILMFILYICLIVIIQQTIFNHFEEIKVLKLLGATDFYILKPHLQKAFVLVNSCFLVSLVAAVGSLTFFSGFLRGLAPISDISEIIRFISPIETLVIIAIANMFAVGGAVTSAKKAIRRLTGPNSPL